MAKEKVVLAYSGGLDTTAIIPWLKENYDYDVVCCCVDCGQGNELDLSLIHISEPTRLGMISYAVFCLKKKKK